MVQFICTGSDRAAKLRDFLTESGVAFNEIQLPENKHEFSMSLEAGHSAGIARFISQSGILLSL